MTIKEQEIQPRITDSNFERGRWDGLRRLEAAADKAKPIIKSIDRHKRKIQKTA